MTETLDTNTETPSAGWRMKVAAFALATSIFAVLWFLIAALGSKWGLWPWQVGLGQMTMRLGPPIVIMALGMSVIALTIALWKYPRFRPALIAGLAFLITALLGFRLFGLAKVGQAVPPIHDIQTDWSDPVQFSDSLLAKRKADGETNPVLDAPTLPEFVNNRWPGLGGKLVADVQEESEAKPAGKGTVYAPMQPYYFEQSPAEIAGLAEDLISRRGWTLQSGPVPSEDSGQEILVEATATSAMFGFKDDVAIRIRPVEGATRVDMRSVSRVGLSDLGANAKRVSGFMNELLDRGDGGVEP